MGYGLMATGMAKRVGDHSKPPIALALQQQILWSMRHLEGTWAAAKSQDERREIAAAAVTTLLGWLGWLRSVELFSLKWEDAKITHLEDGPRISLPLGVGAIELRLLVQPYQSC